MTEVNRLNRVGSPTMITITFQDFASGLWRSYLTKLEIKPSTEYSFDSMLDSFMLPGLGKQLIDQIGPEHITELLDNLSKRGKSGKYLLNVYSLLRTMLEVACEYGLVGQSPVRRKLHRPRYKRTSKPALSADQIRAVLRGVPHEYEALFLCVALTGLRVGELLALRWQDIDFIGSGLSVSHSLWRGQLVSPKTEASARIVHLPVILARLLLELKGKSRWTSDEDFVFCRIDGKPFDPDWLRKKVLHPRSRMPALHGFLTRTGFIFSGTQQEASFTLQRETLSLLRSCLGTSVSRPPRTSMFIWIRRQPRRRRRLLPQRSFSDARS